MITDSAKKFFEACETGQGWAGCKAHCLPNATFASQAEPLADIKSLEGYCDWMKAILSTIPDGKYVVRSFATDAERANVCAYGVFMGTHSGPGGPVPPTGKRIETDYVYVMEFEGDKVRQLTKIWHAGWALKQLGWA